MKIDIPYGREAAMPLEIPDGNLQGVVRPNCAEAGDEIATVKRAIGSPLGGKSLDGFLSGPGKLLVVVNDATRPTPTAKILFCIYDKISENDAFFISAVGSHRPPTDAEHREIFGSFYDEIRDRILVHDCRNETDVAEWGKTSRGTDIKVNKIVKDFDKLLLISSVEPHYFAGYTGGRKSIMPGLCPHSVITQNHKLALDPRARTFALEGNPVHEDMEEFVSKITKDIFSIQTVLDSRHGICYASAGGYGEAFRAAVGKARDIFSVRVAGPADIVVTAAGYPNDIDLYQAQKSIDNGRLALKRGGILILVAECRDGIGNDTFYKLLGCASSPRDVYTEIEKEYKLGYHKAAKMAEILADSRIWAVSSLAAESLEKIFIRSFPDIQSAVDAALGEKGESAKVLVLMDGSLTVPSLE